MHYTVNLGKILRVVKDGGVLRPHWFFYVLKKVEYIKSTLTQSLVGAFRGPFENVRAKAEVALLKCF